MNEQKLPNLNDQLAIERTALANERILLAYGRTALALIVSGTGFSEFLESPLLRTIFLLFIPSGLIVLVVGVIRFWQRKKALKNVYHVEKP